MTDALDAVNAPVELLIADLADEFRDRLARGEAPDPDVYAARHPDVAGLIRGVLKALCLSPSPIPTATPIPTSDPMPSVLGDYRIIREVGRGGMGVVYEAEQISLGRRVALKVLPFAALADSKMLQRFKNEARAAAALDHPHIVKVHAVGQDRGVHFIAMQFIDGWPLSHVIRTHNLSTLPTSPVRDGDSNSDDSNDSTLNAAAATTFADRTSSSFFHQVARLGAQVADALEHAHTMGIVHRDIKPGNLLLDGRGEVWVSDFGLAKLAAADAGVTATGDVFGTLRYMSPEQALAKHNLVDHHTDVYALGATLFELLAGRPAVEGHDKAEILRRITDAEPVLLRRANRSIPVDLETIVLMCLRHEPNDRYASAKDLAEDLRRFGNGEAVCARPVGRMVRASKWASKRPHLVGIAATAVLAIAIAVGLGYWTAYRGVALEAARELEKRTQDDLRTSREGEDRQRFFVLLERVRQRRADPFPGWSRDNLSDLRELARMAPASDLLHDLRTEAAVALSALDLVPAGFVAADFPAYAVDYADDGQLAVAEWRANALGSMRIRVYDPAGQKYQTLTLFADGGWTQWVHRSQRSGGFRAVRFSPDGKWLAAGTNDGRIATWNLGDAESVPTAWIAHRDDHPDFRKSEVRSIGFTAGGVLLSSSRTAIRGWTASTGAPTGLELRGFQLPLDFYPEADRLPVYRLGVTSVADARYHSINLRTGIAETTSFPGAGGAGIAPGGALMAFTTWENDLPQLRTTEPAGGPTILMMAARTQAAVAKSSHFHFDRSGGRLALVEEQDRRLKLFDVANGQLAVDTTLEADVPRTAFAPGGRRLAVAGGHGVAMFDLSSGVMESVAVSAKREISDFAASGDHEFIVTNSQEPNLLSSVCWWQPPNPQPIRANTLSTGGGGPVAELSPDELVCVYAIDPPKATFTLETSDGKRFESTRPLSAKFGPDGRLWLLSEDGTLKKISRPGWVEQMVWKSDVVSLGQGIVPKSLAVSSEWVLVGRRDGRLFRIDTTTGSAVSWPILTTAITALAVDAGSGRAVAGGQLGEVRLIDLRNGEAIELRDAHRTAVTSVAYGRNLIITGSADRRVRLWSPDGQPIATLRMSGPVRKLMLSADESSLLVLVEGERAVRRWRLDLLFSEWHALGLSFGQPAK